VFVKPVKNETKLFSEPDGSLTMHVAAPPTKGKANREIVKWLSKKLGMSSSNVQLIAGLHSTTKTIEITGMPEAEVASTLGIKWKNRGWELGTFG
jgi:uncharacterized protein (TIGR00251 family)